ncbi:MULTISPECIES: substrate-binding domain-containing protein [Devosia]|uniref:Catabolite control protein A n=1 Tax=Devosia equisanguinis TaxID=2490941 RepID=A0A447IET7_9HYPH|nr:MULTISPECIES: substrate-binding domain-containing protein [Devosia]ODT49231.1 MAG: LacI family transcriptional regulator [Pelagibacterium sp. SCN 63-126]ODU85624.1 MAG: LacI family transcriptional regulator [Pelagibacterium sp. SCN 63-17]OJX43466.1 MAG: LacI family transcriptional regulator [Devosia sp. 63-57]VDS05985.1 Catabolite control protein A [Devosia equisanguinis]
MSKVKTKPRKASVSADKVAELAGVSRSAVSRAFTDGASVSPETRAKVLAAADQLGYHVNHLARGLLWHRTGIVCLIVAGMQAPFQASIVEIITRRLQAIGKVVMVLNTSGEAEGVEAALRQTLNYRADATVVISGTPPASLVKTCLENGQRVILINRADPIKGPEFISVENRTPALEACLMLKRAGCRRVAVINSTAGTPGLEMREKTFVEAAAEHGLEVSVSRAGPTGYQTGVDSARQVLATSRRPDGVFCVTDLLALGFMDTARLEFRMNIPEDLCVIGFDDIPEAGWLGYELTTFRQPLSEIADHIVAIVEKEDAEPGQPVVLPTQVVWRKTVRP